MKIDLTDNEQKLLIVTVEQTDYAGKLAHIVAGVLDKLRGKELEE